MYALGIISITGDYLLFHDILAEINYDQKTLETETNHHITATIAMFPKFLFRYCELCQNVSVTPLLFLGSVQRNASCKRGMQELLEISDAPFDFNYYSEMCH